MQTVDLDFGLGSGWIAVVPQGTFAYIHNDTHKTVYYRFGVGSQSNGVPLKHGEYIKVDEVVYFRDNPNFEIKLIVVGD